jgi:hypothetical protein
VSALAGSPVVVPIDPLFDDGPDAMVALAHRYGTDSTLAPVGGVGDPWSLSAADGTEVARYDWDELRFSVSWKAYAFADEAERDAWRTGSDDLDEDRIVDTLVADLAERGVATPDVPRDADLGLLLIDTYVGFPS